MSRPRPTWLTQTAEFNLTPMMDVVLVLLLIALAMAASSVGAVGVSLPRTGGAPAQGGPSASLLVTATGEVRLDGAAVARGELVRALHSNPRVKTTGRVVLQVDRSQSVEVALQVLRAVQESGAQAAFAIDPTLHANGSQP